MKNTGLLFGSFNPIHLGHLIVAQYFITRGGCDEVWLVVSPQNPFKRAVDLAPEQHRLAMARLAVAGNAQLSVCDLEFSLPRPSYTSDTLGVLRSKHPDRKFSLLLGEDLLAQFTDWKDYGRILTHHRLRVYPRTRAPATLPELLRPHVDICEAPRIDISSTLVRSLLRGGALPRYLVPDNVLAYITQHKLYPPRP